MNESSQTPTIVLQAYGVDILKLYADELSRHGKIYWTTSIKGVEQELTAMGVGDILPFYTLPLECFKIKLLDKAVTRLLQVLGLAPRCNRLLAWLSVKLIELRIKPDIWVTDVTQIAMDIRMRAVKVQVFHSVPYKKYISNPNSLGFDLLLLPNQLVKEKIEKTCNVADPDKLKVVGWPRGQALLEQRNRSTVAQKRSFLESLGLDPDKKVVVFAPTWDSFPPDSVFPADFGDTAVALQRLCEGITASNASLIIKLHPHKGGVLGRQDVQDVCRKYNVPLFPAPEKMGYIQKDNNDFFLFSDVLISDTSGCITEFILMDKPVIYLEPEQEGGFGDIPKTLRPGIIAESMPDLIGGLKTYLTSPETHREERRSFNEQIFAYKDENPIAKASEEILRAYRKRRHQ